MNWLNPINWIKRAIASSIYDAIDENVTLAKGKFLVVDGVNLAVTASEQMWTDDQCRTFSRGCRLASKALENFAEAIDPDGVDGRRISVDEFELLIGDVQSAFGVLVSEEKVEETREYLKGKIREKLGL